MIDRFNRPIQTCIDAMAEIVECSPNDLIGPSRRKPLVIYRHIAMAAARQIAMPSMAQIAKTFGRRDHTTVVHALRNVEGMRNNQDAMRLLEECKSRARVKIHRRLCETALAG